MQGSVARISWLLQELSERDATERNSVPIFTLVDRVLKMAAARIKDTKNNKGILYFFVFIIEEPLWIGLLLCSCVCCDFNNGRSYNSCIWLYDHL